MERIDYLAYTQIAGRSQGLAHGLSASKRTGAERDRHSISWIRLSKVRCTKLQLLGIFKNGII